MQEYLAETYFFDYSQPIIQEMISDLHGCSSSEKIARLFRRTRDEWRYSPFTIYLDKAKYRASFVASQPTGHCIDKSVLFIAGLRALGIPARLRLAKVANHIAVESLIAKIGSNHLAPHGIVEVWVDDRWVKASNAFNTSLCEKYQVEVLEFDGTQDAILQAFNQENDQFMEYLEDYGAFADVPLDFIIRTFRKNYPNFQLREDDQGKLVI